MGEKINYIFNTNNSTSSNKMAYLCVIIIERAIKLDHKNRRNGYESKC